MLTLGRVVPESVIATVLAELLTGALELGLHGASKTVAKLRGRTKMNERSPEARFRTALQRIDAANAEDVELTVVDGKPVPAALLYGQRMSARLEAFRPDADDALRLAARAQHIRRFLRPRSAYASGRAGYLAWRTALGTFHADEATRILKQEGYGADTLERVRRVLEKRARRSDADVQLLEDVACLVFLEHYAEGFAGKHAHEKLMAILRKTWAKMSPAARGASLDLPLPASVRALVRAV